MSPGESAAPRNIQGCQVGPRAFWRPRRKGKVSGSTPAAASKARPHWHHVLSQCPSARHKKKKSFNCISQEATSAPATTEKREKHKCTLCYSVSASQRASLQHCLHPVCLQISTSRDIYTLFYITFSHPQLVIFLGSKFTQTKCTAI